MGPACAPQFEIKTKLQSSLATISAPHQEANNRSRHEICHGTCDHGAEAELGKLVTLVGRQSANAADLNTDGTEVGEAAESEGGYGNGARIERGLHGSKVGISDEFVNHRSRAQKTTHRADVFPRHAD